jgi:alkylation response protein AidB-like acyl-CoA dehydrogenase
LRAGLVRPDAAGRGPGGASRRPSHAFQRKLIDQPLMQNVIADMAIEAEAATALVLRLARAYDRPRTIRRDRFARW